MVSPTRTDVRGPTGASLTLLTEAEHTGTATGVGSFGEQTPLELFSVTESEFILNFFFLTCRISFLVKKRSEGQCLQQPTGLSDCLFSFHTATLVYRCQLVTGRTAGTRAHTQPDGSCVRVGKADSSRVAEPADVASRRLPT